MAIFNAPRNGAVPMTNRFLRASLTGLTVSLAIGPAMPDSRLLSTWRRVNPRGMGFVTGII